MKKQEMIASMLTMQHSFNQSVNTDYLLNDYDWDTAIIVEIGEAIEHLPWKWWKHNTNSTTNTFNTDQFSLEVIDIWHFILSKLLQLTCVTNGEQIRNVESVIAELVSSDLFEDLFYTGFNSAAHNEFYPKTQYIIEHLKYMLTTLMCSEPRVDIIFPSLFEDFTKICNVIGINDLTKMFNLYVGKNALNKVRQVNGYKTGEYYKLWDDIHEDNYFMMQILRRYSDPLTLDHAFKLIDNLYNSFRPNQLHKEV